MGRKAIHLNDAAIARSYEGGMFIKDIAVLYGVCSATIKKSLRTMGVVLTSKKNRARTEKSVIEGGL